MTNKYMYFIANWKMYGDLKSLNSLNKVIKFTKLIKRKKIKLIYCPPYTLLQAFYKKIKKQEYFLVLKIAIMKFLVVLLLDL